MKKTISLVLVIALIVTSMFLFAGCGEKKSADNSADEATTESSTNTDKETAKTQESENAGASEDSIDIVTDTDVISLTEDALTELAMSGDVTGEDAPFVNVGESYKLSCIPSEDEDIGESAAYGHINFTAPETKAYTITFSDYKTEGVSADEDMGLCTLYCSTKEGTIEDDDTSFYWKSVKYQSEYNNWAEIAGKALFDAEKQRFDKDPEGFVKEAMDNDMLQKEALTINTYVRTGNQVTIELQENETVEFEFWGHSDMRYDLESDKDFGKTVGKNGFTVNFKIE